MKNNNKINKVAMKYLAYKGQIVGYRIKINSKNYDVAKEDWDKYKEKKYKEISKNNTIEMEIYNNLLMSKEEINNNVIYEQIKQESKLEKIVGIYERCIKSNIWTGEELVILSIYGKKVSTKELQIMGINHNEQDIIAKIEEMNSKKHKSTSKEFKEKDKKVSSM